MTRKLREMKEVTSKLQAPVVLTFGKAAPYLEGRWMGAPQSRKFSAAIIKAQLSAVSRFNFGWQFLMTDT
jgi:hypothetical protein